MSPIAVVQIVTGFDHAGIHTEEGQLTHMRFADGFENLQYGFASGKADFSLLVGSQFFTSDGRSVIGRGTVFGQEVHESCYAHIRRGGGAEKGNKGLVLESLMKTGTHFLFGERSLVKEFFQHGIVGFGHIFNKLFMQFIHAVQPLAFRR